MASRQTLGTALVAACLLFTAAIAGAEHVYLTESEAPAIVFPNADRFDRSLLHSEGAIRRVLSERLGRKPANLWEPSYPIFTAYREGEPIGRAVVVEEIGKHRAITFVVGVGADRSVEGVAIMVYREPYGGEVRSRRFLSQYHGVTDRDSLRPGGDIRNIAGATLSARAIGRGIKKALAVLDVADDRELAHEALASANPR